MPRLTPYLQALRTGEEFLLERFYWYASKAEYTRYICDNKEEWRMTLREPAQTLLAWLEAHDHPEPIHVDEKFDQNPTAAFGVLEAKRHRARGVRFDMFLGMTKLMRQAFIDLVYEVELDEESRRLALDITSRFFDKFELGFATDWVTVQESELIKEFQVANRILTSEKNRYLTCFQSITEPAFVIDPLRRLIDVNKALEDYYGLSRGDLLGRKCHEIIPCGCCEACPLTIVMKDRGRFFGRETSTTVQGQKRIVVLSGSFLDDISGNKAGGMLILQDITIPKQAEAAIRESERRYRRLFESISDFICTHDPDGVILSINPAVTKILGYSQAEIVNRSLKDFLVEELQSNFYDDYLTKIRQWGYLDGLFIMKAKSGRKCYIEYRGKSMDQGDCPLCISLVGRDITDRTQALNDLKKAEEHLRQAQKMEAIGTLAGGIAHDFNNILAAIVGYTELALMDFPDGHPARNRLEPVLKATQRAKDLVKQILTFSRQTEQDQHLVELGPIVKEAAKFLRASLPTTIEIRQTVAEGPWCVIADPTQVHQVLMNLCTNAAHAMRTQGGVLTIDLQKVNIDKQDMVMFPELTTSDCLRLTVTDTGQGMSRETIRRIFEPFFTTKGLGEGTGLGLSVVHGIVKSHGGAIRVYSEAGQGSIFHVYWPVLKKELDRPPKTPLRAIPRGTERILMVDDEEALVRLGITTLSRLGYQVKGLTSSVKALKLFQTDPAMFDLVVTDLTMPQMNGFDLARNILSTRPEMPIILCTGFSEDFSTKRAHEIGIKKVLIKPLIIRDVAQVIRAVLDAKS